MKKDSFYYEKLNKFQELYTKKIAPDIKKYEVMRKRELAKVIFSFVVCVLAILFFELRFWDYEPINKIYYNMPPVIVFLSYLFLGVGGILSFWMVVSIPAKFSKEIKYIYLPAILQVFKELKWQTRKYIISDEEISRSELFVYFNRRIVDDNFIGVYKGVNFKISEISLRYYQRRENIPNHDERVFKGVIITFDANKIFNKKTLVATKWTRTSRNSDFAWLSLIFWLGLQILPLILSKPIDAFFLLLPILAAFLSCSIAIRFLAGKNYDFLDEVKLEDPKFAKRFNVYSSDQVEARYLVTPSFMERFQNLNTAFGAKKAKCSFYDNKIMFAISTNKNLFEVGSIWHSLEDPKSINQLFNELYSVYQIIDYFELDQKLGYKRIVK